MGEEDELVGSIGPTPSLSDISGVTLEFKAAGDEATAMQRAQEFGCLPETVLALVALTDYRVVGSDADDGLLQIEEEWPAAWRIQATRCHRALAADCGDDIDVILRIFAEWQAAQNPDGWCSLWWVNPETMHRVESDVAAVFRDLASAGPIGMRRPVDPSRAPQVRKALTDAFDNAYFQRTGPGRYAPIGEESPEARPYTPTSAVLIDPGDLIIALGSDPRARVIEHLISVDQLPPPVDVLAPVRVQWPVGSVVDIETLGSVSAGRMVTDILTLHRGFAFPDGVQPGPLEAPPVTPELLAAPARPTAPIDGSPRIRGRVVGYRRSDQRQAIILIDPMAQDAPIDPADHPDLATWDDIEVMVRGVESDHLGPLVELGRTDGYGSFFVPQAAGVSASDANFGARLREGARLTARALPEFPDGRSTTVSLLPQAIRHLESIPGVDNSRPVPAKVVHHDGRLGSVTVELEHQERVTGMSHRFQVERGRLMNGFNPPAGTPVDVILRPDRSPARRRLPIDVDLIEFVEENQDSFVVNNGWLEMSSAPADISAVLAMLSLDDSVEWERKVVWLYEDNLHLEAALIGPAGDPSLAEIASTLPGFLGGLKRRATAGVIPAPVAPETSDPMTMVDDSAVPQAPVAAKVRRIVARLPVGRAALVEGADGAAIAELRAGPEVLAVTLQDDIVTVLGQSGRAVRSAIDEVHRLILPAKGRLLMPPGSAKRLIGIDGTTLRALRVRTGCNAYDPGDGEMWVVEGPSHAAVKEFIRLAGEQVPGIVGRVTDMEDLEVLVDDSVDWAQVAPVIAEAEANRPRLKDATTTPAAPPDAPVAPLIAPPAGDTASPMASAEPLGMDTTTDPAVPPVVIPPKPAKPASSRPPIKPLKRTDTTAASLMSKAELRAARAEEKAEAKARAKAEKAAAKAEAASLSREEKAALKATKKSAAARGGPSGRKAKREEARAAKASRKAETAEQKAAQKRAKRAEPGEHVFGQSFIPEGEPPRPRSTHGNSGATARSVVKLLALLLAVAAVAAAVWYAANDYFADEVPVPTDATGTSAAVVEAPAAPAATSLFSPLSDASAVAPSACWLAVMATWDTPEQAAEGVAQLRDIGLPATEMDSNLVPDWAADRTVGVVPVETASQAAEAVGRAGPAGFRGVAVESTVDGCAGLDVVPGGASLGFVDVPVGDADYSAILWVANTGLLTGCNPPIGDLFCPDAAVTDAELATAVSQALSEAPADLDTGSTATATVGDLNGAVGLSPADDTTPLTRRTLAEILFQSYQASGS